MTQNVPQVEKEFDFHHLGSCQVCKVDTVNTVLNFLVFSMKMDVGTKNYLFRLIFF